MRKLLEEIEMLTEMGYQKKHLEREINNLADVIIDHLIKIFKWKDDDNYRKHLKDIDGWIFKIQRRKWGKGKRFKS